jgi:hypothetical protein
MKGIRFENGELARYMFALTHEGSAYQGKIVEVIDVHPFAIIRGTDLLADYRVKAADGRTGICMDWQLRKIDSPADPIEITRRAEVGA